MGKYLTLDFTDELKLMNINKRTIYLLLFCIPLLFSELAMAFFFNKILEPDEFLSLLDNLPQGSISDRQIKRTSLENQELPGMPLENLHFKSCKWHGVDAHEKILKNIIFEDCEFDNVNMRNARLTNVQFIKSRLHNVVMNKSRLEQVKFINSKLVSTDPNIDNSYNGIQADEVVFEKSDLVNIGFFESKAVFRFNNCTLYDVDGEAMKEGSALYLNNTQASILNFSGSDFTNLEVIDSTIDKRSKAGGGSIKNIIVKNSKLEFSLGDNSNIESAVFENSGNVVVGGGKNNKHFLIKNCPKDTYVINAGGGVKKLEIENCHVNAIRITDLDGSDVALKNVSTYSMDFRGSKIEKLVMENVRVEFEIEYTDTVVNTFEQKNISFGKKVDVYREGSNIEIKPDKILED